MKKKSDNQFYCNVFNWDIPETKILGGTMEQKAGLEYLKKAKSNLNSSKILYENGEKINAVYFLQQTVELLSKSFLMYMGAGEKQLKKWMGHDCIVLHKMLESYNKKLMNQKLMPPKEHLEYSKYLHKNAIQDILKEMDSEYLIDGRKNDDYRLMIKEYSKKAESLEKTGNCIQNQIKSCFQNQILNHHSLTSLQDPYLTILDY